MKLMLVNLTILESLLASDTVDPEQFKKAFYRAMHLLELRIRLFTLWALFTICPLIILNAFLA